MKMKLGVPCFPKSVPIHLNITVFPRIYDAFFSFQNNPKDLDPSYKTDLDL